MKPILKYLSLCLISLTLLVLPLHLETEKSGHGIYTSDFSDKKLG